MKNSPMKIIGIDLSGPSNLQDTSLVYCSGTSDRLNVENVMEGVGDEDIYKFVCKILEKGPVVVAMDAPLSYQSGGGDRASDKSLRKTVTELGMKSGSVMTPTMTRMAYLTLRGVSLTRLLDSLSEKPSIIEVHPGAALALHGAPLEAVMSFKQDKTARVMLMQWLQQQGIEQASTYDVTSDHTLAAFGCVLAGWKWMQGISAWIHKAEPPMHPFDFTC